MQYYIHQSVEVSVVQLVAQPNKPKPQPKPKSDDADGDDAPKGRGGGRREVTLFFKNGSVIVVARKECSKGGIDRREGCTDPKVYNFIVEGKFQLAATPTPKNPQPQPKPKPPVVRAPGTGRVL